VREKSEKNLKCSEKNFEIKYNIYQIINFYLMCLLYHESASNLKKRILVKICNENVRSFFKLTRN